jgi:hypothetical protein
VKLKITSPQGSAMIAAAMARFLNLIFFARWPLNASVLY